MICTFVSDLHRGKGNRADDFGPNDKKFLSRIDEQNADKVIIVGDVNDNHQASQRKIDKAHKETSEEFKKDKYVMINGNHDRKKFGVSHLTFLTSDGLKVWAEHLHKGDFLINLPIVNLWNWAIGHWIEPWWPNVDNPEILSSKENRADRKALERAVEIFEEEDADIVIGGHVHRFFKKEFIVKGKRRLYYNCGKTMHGKFQCWNMNTETGEMTAVQE